MMFSLSIDLDPLRCYRRIWGLESDRVGDPGDIVTETAAARFVELADQLELKGTLFVVGEELEREGPARAVERAHQQGHEIANHANSHPYDLSRLPQEQIDVEIAGCQAAVERITGRRPEGFRAPGYLLGESILPAVARNGFAYDSSMLPSPVYQGAKAAAKAMLRLMGRRSGAVLGDPRESLGPNRPYRPDLAKPWRPGQAQLVELPITSVLGIPLTGSVLAIVGSQGAGWIAAAAGRLGFVQLELHGLDLMDRESDRIDPALGLQRDLAIPWQRKVEAIASFVRRLLRSHRPMTLREAAAFFGGHSTD